MAGAIGLLEASAQNLRMKIRRVMGYLAFHCTYVISNAVGVLLRYAPELPDLDTGRGGLGFRPVQWPAHTANIPSHATARHMGMKEACVVGSALVIRERQVMGLRTGYPDIVVILLGVDDWERGSDGM